MLVNLFSANSSYLKNSITAKSKQAYFNNRQDEFVKSASLSFKGKSDENQELKDHIHKCITEGTDFNIETYQSDPDKFRTFMKALDNVLVGYSDDFDNAVKTKNEKSLKNSFKVFGQANEFWAKYLSDARKDPVKYFEKTANGMKGSADYNLRDIPAKRLNDMLSICEMFEMEGQKFIDDSFKSGDKIWRPETKSEKFN